MPNPVKTAGPQPEMNQSDTPELTYSYELLAEATTEEEALVVFHESFDDDVNYTEAGDIHRYDENTFGVFFAAEKPIDTDEEPNVLDLDEVEA